MAGLTDVQSFGLILIVLGVLWFWGVLIWRFRTLRFYERAIPGTAKVTDVQRRSGEGGTSYAAEITFTDSTGEKVYSAVYSTKNVYAVGQDLSISYDPKKPSRAVSESGKWNPDKGLLAFGRMWIIVLVFLVAGLFLTLVPFASLDL